jgi:hypothetical protein
LKVMQAAVQLSMIAGVMGAGTSAGGGGSGGDATTAPGASDGRWVMVVDGEEQGDVGDGCNVVGEVSF